MSGITRQQALLLSILLFFSVIILGCLCLLAIPSPLTGDGVLVIF